MKKLILLSAIAFVAGSASAVTMQWAASGVSFGGSKVGKTTDVVGYLIATDTLDTYTVDDLFDASKIGTQVDTYTGTTATSQLKSAWTIDTDTYGNGDSFAVLLKYTTGEDVYWNLTSSLVTLSGMSLDPPTNAGNVTAAFNYGNGTDGTLAAGGGWVKGISSTPSVPEPATGALALAGVALLFRRRKA